MALNEPNIVNYSVCKGIVTVTHQFRFKYSKTKERPAGQSISSRTHSLAGHNYNVLYYPQGLVEKPNSMCLILAVDCTSTVTISFGYIFLDKHGRPTSKASDRTTFRFSPPNDKFGITGIIERSDLEAEFVKDDYLTLLFSLTIMGDSYKEVPKQGVNGIIPFSINEHFAELLESKEMADVTFEVDGETFTAHRLVLSARSPVFKAEFFGGMAESKMKSIQIRDIKPATFKAMLHFIYSDALPDMSDDDLPIVSQVLDLYKAADIYALDGLKAICEEVLVRDVSMETVISSLDLAEEHNCPRLKDACLRFASKSENLLQLARRADYVQLMSCNPSLLEDFGRYAGDDVDVSYLVSKKQRIN